MWGPHNRRGRKGNSRDHRRSPRRRSPACGRTQSLEKRQCRRGAATRLHDPGADLNPKPRGPVHGDSGAAGMAGRAAQHHLVPRVRPGIQGRPTETHDHSQPRRENWTMWPQDTAHGTFTHSRAIAQAVPTGRGNIPTALRLLETRPVLAMQAYSFKSSEQDASRPETEARRRGPGAPGNASYKHGLGRAGQAPEPRAGVPRRGNESPKW